MLWKKEVKEEQQTEAKYISECDTPGNRVRDLWMSVINPVAS